MKKILSIMIISIMMLSCFMLTASADGAVVSYTASTPDSDGKFTVTITANIAVTGASFIFAYDTSKVQVVDSADGFITSSVDSQITDMRQEEDDNGSIFLNYGCNAAIEAGSPIATVTFKKLGKVSATDVVFYDSTNAAQLELAMGDLIYVTDDAYNEYMTSAGNASAAYVYSAIVDEEDEPEPEPDPVYTWGAATDVVADETGVTGTKVAVFGKVSGGAGKVLADNEYWVTFGQNTYYGKASTSAVTAWAIVIYDPNGTKVEAGRTYGYTAGMTGVPSWTGSVTASAVAAE